MKHPKRFCAECDQDVYLTIRGGKVPMYHCRKCGAEVCRVGDGDSTRQPRTVKSLDVRSIPEDVLDGANILDIALENPDVLSNEHTIWGPRDREAERERQAEMATFSIALDYLTARQREVVDAIAEYGSVAAAGRYLGLSPSSTRNILKQAKKKLGKYVADLDKQGLKGELTNE